MQAFDMSIRPSKQMLWGSGVMGGTKNLCLIADCPFCKRAKTHTQQQVTLKRKVNRLNIPSVSGFSDSMGGCASQLSMAPHPPSFQLNELLGLTSSIAPVYTQCKEGFEPLPPPMSFADSVRQAQQELGRDASVLQAQSENIDAFERFLEELIEKEEVQLSNMHQNVQLQVFRDKFEKEQEVLQQKHEEQKSVLVRQLTRHRSHLESLQNEGMRLARERQQREADRIALEMERETAKLQKQLRKEKLAYEKQQRMQEFLIQKQQAKEARVAKKVELVSAAEQYEQALNQQIEEYMLELLELDQAVGFLTGQLDVQTSHAKSAENLNKHVQEMLWAAQEENIALESELSCTDIETKSHEENCAKLSSQLQIQKEEAEKERLELQDYSAQVRQRLAFLDDRCQQYKKKKAQKREIGRINSIWEPEKSVIEQEGKVEPPMPPPPPPLLRSRSQRAEEEAKAKSQEVQDNTQTLKKSKSVVLSLKEEFEVGKSAQSQPESLPQEEVEETKAKLMPSLSRVSAKKEEFENQIKEEQQPRKPAIKKFESKLLVSSIRDGFERKITQNLDGDDSKQVKSIMKDFERSTTVSRNAVKARKVHFENQANKEQKEHSSVHRNLSTSDVMKFASQTFKEQNKRNLARRNSTRPNLRVDSERWNNLVKIWQTDKTDK